MNISKRLVDLTRKLDIRVVGVIIKLPGVLKNLTLYILDNNF